MNNGKTLNDVLMDAVRAGEMHCAAFLYSDAVEKFGNAQPAPGVDPSVHSIMQRMTILWGMKALLRYSDQGFKENFLSAEQVKALEELFLEVRKHKGAFMFVLINTRQTCKGLRKQVIGLTDSFGFPDFVLKAPIAKYDGDIYQRKLHT